MIETVLDVLRPLFEESQGRVVCAHLPTVQGDPIQLEQSFQNLLSNVIKYRRAEETLLITVSSRPIAGGWEFAVEDNGQGIPPESQDQIFEPLKRLHGSKIPGAGLGLALCGTIVERHGSRIWVETIDGGQGAKFRFTLCEEEIGARRQESECRRNDWQSRITVS